MGCLTSLQEQQERFLENQRGIGCKSRNVGGGMAWVQKAIKEKVKKMNEAERKTF